MNSHKVQGIAAMTVSQFLRYCIQQGMVDEILAKTYPSHEADQIKQAIQDIADTHARSAAYHKSMLPLGEA